MGLIEDVLVKIQALPDSTITTLMRQALDNPTAELLDWQVTPLSYAIRTPLTGGIFRITGTAQVEDKALPWSMIMKAVTSPAGRLFRGGITSPDGWGIDETHYQYWKREPLIYQQGLLDELHDGLIGPRCFAIQEQSDDAIWLWLEEVQNTYETTDPYERCSIIARHLGRFNGTYLVDRPLPNNPFLSRNWQQGWCEDMVVRFDDHVIRTDVWEHSVLRQAFPTPVITRFRQLQADRARFLQALSWLPQTFCHHDANVHNLFLRRKSDGTAETVAVDWAFSGSGAVGEEISQYFCSHLLFDQDDTFDRKHLDRIIFRNYLAGLDDAGWKNIDATMETMIRFGFAASAALRWGIMIPAFLIIHPLLDEQVRKGVEHLTGRPLEQIIEQRAATTYYLLDLADEARKLLQTIFPE